MVAFNIETIMIYGDTNVNNDNNDYIHAKVDDRGVQLLWILLNPSAIHHLLNFIFGI